MQVGIPQNDRSWSTLTIKSIDEDQRVIHGIASTPSTDRVGDIVEPRGARFKTPLPFLMDHGKNGSDDSIGHVESITVKDDGIHIRAKIVRDPALPYIDAAWAKIKHGLARGLSIGFRGKEVEPIKGGIRFKVWELLEISAVVIPANPEASITSIKSFDTSHQRAASGVVPKQHTSLASPFIAGVSASTSKGTNAMQTSFAEKISGYEGERSYKTGRMSELLSASTEDSRSMNETEQKEFDDLKVEVEAIDKQVGNLRTHQKLLLTSTPVDGNPDTATQQRTEAGRPSSIIFQRQNAFPGQAFAKLAMAVMVGKGSRSDTEMLIRDHCKDMPQVMAAYKALAYDKINKAAVAAGTTTDSNWAAPLVNYQDLASEFIELLRPETIIGRLPLLRRIPFNVRMPKIASGVSAQWVGQGLAKPVQAMDFDSVTHLFHKLAVIVVLTEELMKFSNPAAEQVVRDEIVAAVAQKKDTSFIDPSLAAVGATSPASITNGLSNIGNPGTSLATITTALTRAIANVATANINMSSGAWVMRPQTAVYLSTLLTTQDNRAFPGMSLQGGTLFGFPVVVSGNMVADTGSSGFIVFLIQREIFISDDGATRIDASGEASVQMDSAPSAGAQSLVSLWQNNMVGLKAEQFTTWTRRRTEAVQVIEDVSF